MPNDFFDPNYNFQYVETKAGGWLHKLEDYARLEGNATPLFALPADTPIPETVNPTSWVQIENQGNQGACQGHALSSCIEDLHIRGGGDYVQLSRANAYYRTQKLDGISGDRGSTIEGGCRLARTEGIVLESVWPYPSSYNPREPAGFASAPRYKIEGHVILHSAEEVFNHIGRRGPVSIGIMWGNSLDQQASANGIIETFRPGGGGHALMLAGYRNTGWDGSSLNDRYAIMANSWSTRWGYKGWALVSPRAINQMIAHQWSVFAGLYGSIAPVVEPPLYF